METEAASDVTDYTDELESVHQLKKFFISDIIPRNLKDTDEGHVYKGTTPWGCTYRCVLPNINGKPTGGQADDCHFVGFFGITLAQLDEKTSEELWDIDWQLIDVIKNTPPLICYITVQRFADQRHWFNMVLLKEWAGVELWNQGSLHKYCVRSITPKCYTRIRIHTGRQNGRHYTVYRTTFLTFKNDLHDRELVGRLRRDWHRTVITLNF